MSAFEQLRLAIQAKAQELFTSAATGRGVLVLTHAEQDHLWNLYLESIPKEHNQIFRERRYYDGNYDKHFIRKLGGLKFINADLTVTTIWDVDLPADNYFCEVVKKLDEEVMRLPIRDYFFTTEKVAGHLANVDNYDYHIIWDHFFTIVPDYFITGRLGEKQGKLLENKQLLQRSIDSLKLESAELVLDLINTGDLYRGNEFSSIVKWFIDLKKEFETARETWLVSEMQTRWYWLKAYHLGDRCRIRNTVIGTLMEDISQGMELEQAVKSFESKVAPTNYKRTTAVVTPKMVEQAKETVKQLGYETSVYRRLAIEKDIPVTERLFTAVKHQALDVFDAVKEESASKVRKLDNLEEISWDEFRRNVLPAVSTVEVLKQNGLKANEFVMTAPMDDNAPTMFKWDNGIAWTYLSDTADAIKSRVKEAGGNVDGDVRVSLAWHSPCDLDLWCETANGRQIYFNRNHRRYCGGELDVDMNGLDRHDRENPVENIVFENLSDMPDGLYKFGVDPYSLRSPRHDHFDLQAEILGNVYTYRYNTTLRTDLACLVLRKQGTKVDIIAIDDQLELISSVSGGVFETVKMIIRSPNYWGENKVGNEHILFITDNFTFKDPVRGFFNEYLVESLMPHRKVFELLGNKARIEPSDTNVGGYGFSVTSKAELVVRAKGATKRVYKIKF